MDITDLIAQGKVKRVFRAKNKLTAPNLVSHLTQRAAGKEPLFVEEADYLYMLAALKAVAQSRSLELYAFCLMPNHVHLLASPRHDALEEAMRDLFSGYARMFNRKYERRGHLFGGPYRQAVCLDDGYLLAASIYIHMNPVRAGLARGPLDYRWSSAALYCRKGAPRGFVRPGFVLRLLPGDAEQQKHRYVELLERSGQHRMQDALEAPDSVPRLLQVLAGAFPGLFAKLTALPGAEDPAVLPLLSEADLDAQIRRIRYGGRPMRPETRKARRFLMQQLVSRGYSRREIAERFGVSAKTVYNALRSG